VSRLVIPESQRRDYFVWREWILGEGRFAPYGPRQGTRPQVRFGGPGQQPVPDLWWEHLEEYLVRRHDGAEAVVKPPVRDRVLAPVRRAPADPRQVSAHFHAREFACHDGRQVPKIALPGLDRLADKVLEPMRAKFGPCRVLSGYRPADYNARIGGARFSQHIYELTPSSVAADLTFARGGPDEWYREADRILSRLGYGGAGRYPRSGFVHVDNRPTPARWSG
jgi:hypothetical protein